MPAFRRRPFRHPQRFATAAQSFRIEAPSFFVFRRAGPPQHFFFLPFQIQNPLLRNKNEICPLCCEDLDLSDKSFYPCKCGYQVCMWCWHRIRETESGLCPACRTPYGDDPHEFSAVDMEDVVKANKEKAAAEKRERERLRAVREQKSRERLAGDNASGGKDRDRDRDGGSSGGGGGGGGSGGGHGGGSGGGGSTNFAGALVSGGGLGSASSFGQFDGADLVAALGSAHHASLSAAGGAGHPQGARGPPEPPKDRSTLATMRVIRRNLVYAVGMPPNIAVEDNLRKPEYFGQYGKISKIVINRNHNPGDPRRASASAYVTFAHKVRHGRIFSLVVLFCSSEGCMSCGTGYYFFGMGLR